MPRPTELVESIRRQQQDLHTEQVLNRRRQRNVARLLTATLGLTLAGVTGHVFEQVQQQEVPAKETVLVAMVLFGLALLELRQSMRSLGKQAELGQRYEEDRRRLAALSPAAFQLLSQELDTDFPARNDLD